MTATLWMHAHRRSLLFLCLILALGGVLAALRMPVSLFPDVSCASRWMPATGLPTRWSWR